MSYYGAPPGQPNPDQGDPYLGQQVPPPGDPYAPTPKQAYAPPPTDPYAQPVPAPDPYAVPPSDPYGQPPVQPNHPYAQQPPPPGWQPPPPGYWQQPAAEPAQGDSNAGAVLFGIFLVLVGAWFLFRDEIALELGQLWPALAVGLGLAMVVAAFIPRRRSKA